MAVGAAAVSVVPMVSSLRPRSVPRAGGVDHGLRGWGGGKLGECVSDKRRAQRPCRLHQVVHPVANYLWSRDKVSKSLISLNFFQSAVRHHCGNGQGGTLVAQGYLG